jgi:hypothetical protein
MAASGVVRRASIVGENVGPEPGRRIDRTLGPPVPRTCGRCRQPFPGDTALDPAAVPWSVCSPCRIKLFGDGSHPHMASRWASTTAASSGLADRDAES